MLLDIPNMSVNTISFFSKKSRPKPTIVYDTYWKFAAERQEIFFRRLQGLQSPWTEDPILRNYKFTNAYRAADKVSQYLIKHVIYSGDQSPNEVLFRILLFKIFNKIETWQALVKQLGEIRYENYEYNKFNKILENIRLRGNAIYSGAYIMASGKSIYGYDFKHQNHLKLLEKIIQSGFAKELRLFKRMEDVYTAFLKFPTIGSFLAYQYAIDVNYSNLTDFSEMDFVKAGPGAIDGIRKCFSDTGGYSEEDIIKMVTDRQFDEFERLEINFKDLWGRPLQLIDCQNLFCEVDKYSRVFHPEISGVSDRTRIKQRFSPTSLKPLDYFFPPKWNLHIV